MSRYDDAVGWVVGRLEGVDAGFRQDLLATVRELAPTAGRGRRAVELFSLTALALRLRSRARTAGTRFAQWSQGVYLGGVVLALVLSADRWAAAAATALPAAVWSGGSSALACALAWLSALAATGAVACGLAHCRIGAASWSALTVLAGQAGHVGASGGPGPGTGAGVGVGPGAAVVAGYAVVVLAVLFGDPGPVRRCRSAVASVASAPVASVALVLLVGTDVASLALHLSLSVVGPALLLAAGTFDPRLAVAGTVVWFWRLAASSVVDLVDALAALGHEGEGGSLLRWLTMSVGVALAVTLTRNSIRRLYEF